MILVASVLGGLVLSAMADVRCPWHSGSEKKERFSPPVTSHGDLLLQR